MALATPPGNSGVAVIRISGDKAGDILKKITKVDTDYPPREMLLKNVFAGEIVDNALVVFFASPNSFTGEDVAEIHSHGGYFLAQYIIDECVKLGARPAGAGEFSKRAFLNGKLSLDQAEGIMDLINAETRLQAVAGSKLLNGKLLGVVEELAGKLTDILAEIEARLDYPEYEYSTEESGSTLKRIVEIRNNLAEFVSKGKSGLVIKNGIKVAITRAPTVGKSSLLNALTNTNKAIVTSIAGTTRDVVEGEYNFGGIIFRLFDTAGIRDGADEVENIGIKRALEVAEDADIVLKVFDENSDFEVETDKPVICVVNKEDLLKNKNKFGKKTDIFVSAKTGNNLEKLKQLIFDKTVGEGLNTNNFYLTNARHIDCVNRAVALLGEAVNEFDKTTLDVISNLIKSAWHCLCEITGVSGDEEIVDKIFSKFCLGK